MCIRDRIMTTGGKKIQSLSISSERLIRTFGQNVFFISAAATASASDSIHRTACFSSAPEFPSEARRLLENSESSHSWARLATTSGSYVLTSPDPVSYTHLRAHETVLD